MMILSILVLFFSMFMQGVISTYTGYLYSNLTFFSTLYVLDAILILSPYFENKKKYFLLLLVFGLSIDIAYTNTFMLNTCLFVFCYFISKLFHSFFPYNWLTVSASNVVSVWGYHFISFVYLNLLKYDVYSFKVLFHIFSHSILMTIIYSSLLYIIVNFIFKKFELKIVK